MRTSLAALLLLLPCLGLWAFGSSDDSERSLEVTATAYNSVRGQTNAQPWTAAWGDRLRNGMKVIAVSRDLLDLGVARGTSVRIDGLPGEYLVLDKMNRRWKRAIDVYMGDDVGAARHFGRRDVTIRWASQLGEAPGLAAVAAAPPPPAESIVAEAEPR